jgi:hypothetical protein
MVTVAVFLDTLPAPFTDGEDKVGMTSSPAQILALDRLSHPDVQSESQVHHQNCPGGDKDAQSEHRMWNPHRGGHDDHEGCSLSPEGLGPKSFGSNMSDAHFPKCFRTPSNVIKYDGTTNPSIWLEDYHLACRAGRQTMTYSSSNSSPFT